MEKIKVVEVNNELLKFNDGTILTSNHKQYCCEHHWLSFEHLTMQDFEGLEFDLSNDSFFKKVKDYGIELLPISGHPIRIPGYGSNNGYYSTQLELSVTNPNGTEKNYDISECQEISGSPVKP